MTIRPVRCRACRNESKSSCGMKGGTAGLLARSSSLHGSRACSILQSAFHRTEQGTPRIRMTISALDFKLGIRMLRRYPGLSLIGGLALSVAIAVGIFAFEQVNAQLNPSLPLDEGDRIVRIENFNR